jgi:hypothetical protein
MRLETDHDQISVALAEMVAAAVVIAVSQAIQVAVVLAVEEVVASIRRSHQQSPLPR